MEGMHPGAKGAPYAKVRPWMGDGGLRLKGPKLSCYALLWERDVEPGEDSGRINAGYIAAACDRDEQELFRLLCELVSRDGLLRVDMGSSGGLVEGFRADPALLGGPLAGAE